MWFPPVSSTVAVAFASSPSSTCSPPNPSQQWSSSLRPGLWITASATMGHHITYLASHRDAGVLSALIRLDWEARFRSLAEFRLVLASASSD